MPPISSARQVYLNKRTRRAGGPMRTFEYLKRAIMRLVPVGRPDRSGTEPGAVANLVVLFEQTISFHLDKPRRIDKPGNLHEGARRTNFPKKLTMGARRIPPL